MQKMMKQKPARDQASAEDRSDSRKQTYIYHVLVFYGIGIVFLLGASLVSLVSQVLLLVFASILLAIALYDGSQKIKQWLNVPHLTALGMLLFCIVVIVGGLGWLLAPQLSEQARELFKTMPTAIERLLTYIERYDWISRWLGIAPSAETLLTNASRLFINAGGIFTGTIGALGNLLIVSFVGTYLAAQPHLYMKGLVALVPQRKRARTYEVLDEIGQTLAQWMIGRVFSMAIVGTAAALGLYLLDVPLALALGFIAGLLDFIPYIGPFIAAVPAILIALTDDNSQLAVYVALLFLAIQLAEGYLLLPLVERRTVSLPPALTIIMQVLMGSLFGLMGVALATPLTAVVVILVAMLYVHDALGDSAKAPPEQ